MCAKDLNLDTQEKPEEIRKILEVGLKVLFVKGQTKHAKENRCETKLHESLHGTKWTVSWHPKCFFFTCISCGLGLHE